jgi:hypothetical protein
MNEEIFNLANNHVQQAICDALTCLKQTSPTILPNRSIRPAAPLRCRSSSNNRNNRKVPFHNTIPRCSLPATKNDLVHYQSRLLSYQQSNQTRCETSQNINKNRSNRTCDVQYSFSLNKPWLTKVNKQRQELMSIQNFANKFVEQSIQDALFQVY